MNTHKESRKDKIEKLNKMWMGKEYKYPIQSPYDFDKGHWFMRVGRVVVESTTRKECLESRKEGDESMLREVMKHDIATFGG
jgi:hypothetical protein